MKRRLFLVILVLAFCIALLFFGNYWVSTQPIWIVNDFVIDDTILKDTPQKNKKIVDFVERNGLSLAPSYEDVVCTEFVINVVDRFDSLTNEEKNKIRIITSEKISDLIRNEAPVIKGIQSALTYRGKGIEINNLSDVRPGDFVQFWNEYQGNVYGHCGVVLDIQPNQSLSLYSSHPLTNGYGKQKYRWPDKTYFVRLK